MNLPHLAAMSAPRIDFLRWRWWLLAVIAVAFAAHRLRYDVEIYSTGLVIVYDRWTHDARCHSASRTTEGKLMALRCLRR